MSAIVNESYINPIAALESCRSNRRVSRCDEWHLDFGNAFRHLAFDFGAWLGQPAVVIAPPFFHTRFEPIAAVGDSMGGDGIEQVLGQI